MAGKSVFEKSIPELKADVERMQGDLAKMGELRGDPLLMMIAVELGQTNTLLTAILKTLEGGE